ncbi:hypothetical protein [Jannaschia sp. M317]|uniref:hypothetical protein n=1 Tax=Jannaschia sp. M317 TaxID=2867011 RepID=UPI0021A59668|nr:hypothetical protein [Jannaschia sp. M317]UWQ18085.1 hypothetical protein K3551_01900 [Jannaschia sp. M317]
MGYGEDSLWTLTSGQIAGVLALSLAMWAGCLWAVRRARGRTVRVGVAVLSFAAFVWLSPQIYYLFYWLTFEGLPLQSVLRPPPTPAHLLRLLTFTQEASLSRHGQGGLGWSLLLAAWPARSPGAGSRP